MRVAAILVLSACVPTAATFWPEREPEALAVVASEIGDAHVPFVRWHDTVCENGPAKGFRQVIYRGECFRSQQWQWQLECDIAWQGSFSESDLAKCVRWISNWVTRRDTSLTEADLGEIAAAQRALETAGL